MKPNRTLPVLAILALTMVSLLPLTAATFTWTDGAGNFIWDKTSTNWTTGSGNIPWSDGNNVVLGPAGAGAIMVSGTQSITNLIVSAAGYSLAGGQISMGVPDPFFQISNNITIGSVISGSLDAIFKTGPGTLTFSGVNTYTGGTYVVQGNLVLNAGALGVGIVHGEADVSSGATLTLQGNTNQTSFPVAGSDTIYLNATGTNAYAAATLVVAGASGANGYAEATYGGTINLVGDYGGGANVTTPDNSLLLFQGGNGGTVNSTGAGSNSFTAGIVLKNTGGGTCTFYVAPTNILSVSGPIADYPGYTGNPLLFTGGGLVSVTGSNSYSGPTTINGVTVAISTLGNGGSAGNLGAAGNSANNLIFANGALLYAGATASTDRGFTLQAGTTNTFDIANNTLTFSNVCPATSGTLVKTGAGTLALAGTNSYSGSTIVSNGTLLVNGSLPNSAVSIQSGVVLGGQGQLGSSLTLVSGAVLDLSVTPAATNGLTVAGTAILNGAITVSPLYLGAALQPGTYTVLTCNGGVSGTYSLTWSDPTGQTAASGFSLNGNKLQVTLGTKPLVTTLAASSVTVTNATLNGTVNPEGLGTSTYFEYGVDTNYGSIGGLSSGGGFGSVPAGTTPVPVAGAVVSHLAGPAGTIWTNLNSFPNNTNNYIWKFLVSSADGTCLAAIDGNIGGTGIWTSTNSGVSWSQHTNNLPLADSQYYSAMSSSADGTHLAAGNFQGIYISTNSGVAWQKSDGPGTPSGMAASGDGTYLVAVRNYTGPYTNNGGIWASTNSGVHWFQLVNSPSPQTNYTAIASSISGRRLAAVASGGPLFTSIDGGFSWTQQTNAPVVSWQAIASSADGSHLVGAAEYGGIYTSTNGGVNWVSATNAPNAIWQYITLSADGSRSAAVAINGTYPYSGYVYTNGGIYTSADGGGSWTLQTNAPVANTWYSIAASADGSHLAAGTLNYVWTSSGASANLTPGTTYHYQLAGFNAAGAGLGGDQTFTTGIAAPTATTGVASGIAATTTTLNGAVNPGGGTTATYFRYGLTASYGSFSATNTVTAGNATVSVSNLISNLTPGTLYHYQLVAANSAGSNSGTDQTFTTIPAVPIVTTLAATTITATNAMVDGSVNPAGGATLFWFQYGLTTNYGGFSVTNMLAGTNATLSVSNLISGLNPSATYHYQLVAANSSGTAYGNDLTLNTPAGPLTVATLAATGVTAITATLNGTVYPGGNAATAWFQYGLTTGYGSVSATTNLPATYTTLAISNLISGLNPNTTYHFQMVASNSMGIARGGDMTLNTPTGYLTVTTLAASSVTATNATLNGSVIPFSFPATAYFEYGADTNYGNLGDYVTLPAANAATNMPGLLVASVAGPAGSAWQQVEPAFPPWQSIAMSADGTHLAAGSFNNGIYTSTNSGATWTQQTNSPTTTSEAIASSADGTRLAAALYNNGIYTSTNSGVTWTHQTNAPTANWQAIAASADGTRLLAAAGFTTGLYLSTNSGITWTQSAPAAISNYRWYSVATSADGTRLTAVAGYEGIWASTDGGVTWTQQTNVPNQYWSSIVSSADGTRLAVGSNQTNFPVYTSTNGGTTWSATTSPALSWTSLASSADGARLVAMVAGNGVWTSTNGGGAWSQGNAPSNTWTAVASSADGTRLALAGNGSGIWTSMGATSALTAGLAYHYQLVGMNNASKVLGGDLTFTLPLSLPAATTLPATGIGTSSATLNGSVNPNRGTATAWFQYGTSTNYGSVTATVNLPATNSTLAVSNLLSNLAAGTTYHFQLVSSNNTGTSQGGDLSFTTSTVMVNVTTPVVTTLAASSVTSSNATLNGTVNPGNGQTAAWFEYGLTTGYGDIGGIITLPATNTTLNLTGLMVRSLTGPAGATWYQAPTAGEYWSAIASSADGTHLVAVDNNGAGIWTSTDGGVTWSQTSAPGYTWVGVASSADGTRLTAVSSDGTGAWTSTNSGGSWYQDNLPGDNWFCDASSADGTHLTVGGSNSGIWASSDGGITWAQQTNAPGNGYTWYAIASSADGTRLAASAGSAGIWTSTNSGLNWMQQTNASTNGCNWSDITSSADGAKLAATTYADGIWTSTNSGMTWTQQTNAPVYVNWYSIASSADGSRLAAVEYFRGIWTSTDGGVTWAEQANAPTNGYPWCSIASSADGTFLAAVDDDEDGVWTSTGAATALAPGTTYHYQLVGFNRAGTGFGGDQTFTTAGASPSQPVSFQLKLARPTAGGSFQLSFTNLTGLGFTVLGATNLTQPLTNWTVLGSVVESPAGSGQYQLTNLPATNRPTQFYRVRSP